MLAITFPRHCQQYFNKFYVEVTTNSYSPHFIVTSVNSSVLKPLCSSKIDTLLYKQYLGSPSTEGNWHKSPQTHHHLRFKFCFPLKDLQGFFSLAMPLLNFLSPIIPHYLIPSFLWPSSGETTANLEVSTFTIPITLFLDDPTIAAFGPVNILFCSSILVLSEVPLQKSYPCA